MRRVATEEVSRWFNIKIENRWRLKGDLSWPSWERVWAAGFCRYLTKGPTAEHGNDEKNARIERPWLLLARVTAAVGQIMITRGGAEARKSSTRSTRSTSRKEETSHEPSARVTWPETGTRVRTDSELLGSFQGQVRMMGGDGPPVVRQIKY